MAEYLPLGPYRLVRKLATGGMAEIFLARQEGPDGFTRDLVVKRILPHLTADREFTRMFREEARLAARLAHPNVVQVTDFGAVTDESGDESLYLAMELVRGVDLRALIARAAEIARSERRDGGIPPHHAAKITSFVCEALAHAHALRADGRSLGIVHRDVTPSNVLVSFDGAVKLADFGIAKAASTGRAREATRHGVVKGKYAYLSPEQARGEALDARSDLFNVGILLFEAVLGEPLFPHDDGKAARELSARGAIPGVSRFSRMPPALAAVAKRALAARKEERYPDALALRADLEAFLRTWPEPSDAVEIGRYVRTLFPDAVEEDARGPRAAGTVKGTAVLTPQSGQRKGTEVLPQGAPRGTEPLATAPRASGGVATPPPEVAALLTAPPTEVAAPPAMMRARSEPPRRNRSFVVAVVVAAAAGVTAAFVIGTLAVSGGAPSSGPPPLPALPPREPEPPIVASPPVELAHLHIASDPAALSIRVDGRERGATPLVLDVDPEVEHRIEARDAEGVLRAETTLVLAAAETREVVLSAPVEESTATLRVATSPAGATVSVDGAAAGVAPLAIFLEPGAHRVVASLDGYEEVESEVTLERAGEQQTLTFALTRAPPEPVRGGSRVGRRRPPAAGRGTLTIATTPWSEVYLGSRHLGTTPLANVELPAGTHTLTLRPQGRPAQTTRVTIRTGEATRVRLAL